jgi:hypothetical protein
MPGCPSLVSCWLRCLALLNGRSSHMVVTFNNLQTSALALIDRRGNWAGATFNFSTTVTSSRNGQRRALLRPCVFASSKSAHVLFKLCMRLLPWHAWIEPLQTLTVGSFVTCMWIGLWAGQVHQSICTMAMAAACCGQQHVREAFCVWLCLDQVKRFHADRMLQIGWEAPSEHRHVGIYGIGVKFGHCCVCYLYVSWSSCHVTQLLLSWFFCGAWKKTMPVVVVPTTTGAMRARPAGASGESVREGCEPPPTWVVLGGPMNMPMS